MKNCFVLKVNCLKITIKTKAARPLLGLAAVDIVDIKARILLEEEGMEVCERKARKTTDKQVR